VYATLAEETMIHYEGLHDEGQVSWILGECATGLVACLNAQPALPQNERLGSSACEELLTTLFDLWKFGYTYGGVGVDVAGAMAEHATAVEHFGDEDVLEEYRKVGLYKEMAEKFLQLVRQKEALAVAQANLTEPMDVTWFAEQLLKSGELWQDQALAFVEMRLGEVKPALHGKPQDFTSAQTIDTSRRWLGEKYLLYGKAKQTVDMELARFQANPDHTTYRSIRSAALATGQPGDLWPGLRPQLIQTLEQKGRWGALVSLYLDEKEVGQALAALAEMERTPEALSYGYRSESPSSRYQAQVAEAAEESYPDEALRLYKPVVQRLIDGRGREHYQQATVYLTQIKRLYQKQGQEAEWERYITNLRNSNKSLRALKEELDKRGL